MLRPTMAIETRVKWLRYRRTKIVATIGPASHSPSIIGALLEHGVNVFRLNMSHGTHDEHRVACERIREMAAHRDRPAAVLADLSGPKIRVGSFAGGGISLTEGETVALTVRDVLGGPGLIPSRYRSLAADVAPGDTVLLADGLLELAVESVEGTEVRARVVKGGRLSDRQGINLPGVALSVPCLTEKDRADARVALDLGVDFLALSFVRRAEDIAELRALLEAEAEPGTGPPIIAKIERPEALLHSEAITAAADGIMVARGDLGVELPLEEVPIAQQELIQLARRHNKPVIVATQMLESMIQNPRPTRAEVADVSQSVADGADAVMLSGETAAGAYPVEAVRMMDRIARQTEGHLWQQGAFGTLTRRQSAEVPLPFGDAVGRATALLSRDLRVRAVMAISRGGMTAATVSSARPGAPVVAISPRADTYRRMSLLWGAIPVLVDDARIEEPAALARQLAPSLGLAASGEYILLVQGFSADPAANTPSITLLQV